MATMNIGRSARLGSESGISGSEALSVEIPASPDQIISALTEEEVTIPFRAYDLQVLSMVCDQAVKVQVLETRFAILATTAGPPGTITYTGDLEQEIFAGDIVRIEGTVGNDGYDLVETVVVNLGVTTITLANGQWLVGAEGVIGTVSRVANHQLLGYAYTLTTTTQLTGAIVLAGNVTDKFAEGDYLEIQGSVAENGLYYVMSAVYAAPNTTIIVSDPNLAIPAGALAADGVAGQIVKSLPSIVLAANKLFLWDIDSGLQNPLISPNVDFELASLWNVTRGNVAAFMVNNDNAINANFDARVGTNSYIFA